MVTGKKMAWEEGGLSLFVDADVLTHSANTRALSYVGRYAWC